MGLTVHAGGEFEAGNKYYDPFQFTSLVVAMAAKVSRVGGVAFVVVLCCVMLPAKAMTVCLDRSTSTHAHTNTTTTPALGFGPDPRALRRAGAAGAVAGPHAAAHPARGQPGAGGDGDGRAGAFLAFEGPLLGGRGGLLGGRGAWAMHD